MTASMSPGRDVMRLLVLCLVFLASMQAIAQSALSQQFLSLPPAERERMMRDFGLSPDEVLGAIRDGAASGGPQRSPADAPMATPGAPSSEGRAPVSQRLGAGYVDPLGRFVPYENIREPAVEDLSLDGAVPYELRQGLELFVYGLPSYQELYSIPIPADYRIGPGDTLVVSLYGKESTQFRLVVTRDGVIDVPMLGPIRVDGLEYEEARELIGSRIAQEMIGVSASVTIDQLKSIQVAVSGEVQRPGVYVVPALVSAVQLLALAGGPTELGSLREVRVSGPGGTRLIDLYDFAIRGDGTGVVVLKGGDAIHVPPVASAVQVKGAVRRPGIYEARAGETVEDLIDMAGGLVPDAAPGRAAFRRYDAEGLPIIEDLALNLPASGARSLEDGMILAVPRASALATNRVELRGAVPAAGSRQWRPGMMVSDLIGDLRRDVRLEDADLDHAYVVRTDARTRGLTFLSFAPRDVAAGDADVELLPEDVVLVLSLPGLVSAGEQAEIDRLLGSTDASSDESGSDSGVAPPSNPIVAMSGRPESGAAGLAGLLGGTMAGGQRSGMATSLPGAPEVLQGPRVDPREVLAANARPSVRRDEALRSREELLAPFMERLRARTRDGSRVRQFTVLGEVHSPGIFPLTIDGDLADALAAAGGLLESADSERAVLLRKADVTAPLEVLEVPMSEILSEGGVALEPGDVITIGRDPSLANRLELEIDGEVASPGKYVLPAGSTLSDLLEIAGGATPRADLRSAVFSRARLRQMEREVRDRYLTDIRKSIIDGEVAGDSRTADPAVLGMLEDLATALEQQADGRLQIDLPRLAAGDRSADVRLSTGDRLTIPSKTSAVSVAGQVRVAGSFAYVRGMDAESYLEMAGGISNYADDDAIFIVRADGAVELLEQRRSFLRFNRSGTELLPGDRIVVPIDTEYVNTYDLTKDIVQFVYQTGIGLAAVVAAFQ